MNEQEKRRRFQELIAQNKGILFKVARTYCRDKEDIPDLMQEISIQVWRSVEKYDERYKVSTWLYRIALNVAISFYRKNVKRQEHIIPLNDDISPAGETESTDNEQQLTLLEQFISELGDLDKALMLLYLEDRSHSEIADIMGISKSNVGTRIGRIKEKLRTRFSQSNL
ncbi:sigma-70 family RNA polymerase sigma factor [Flavihumibacter sp. R14]|nr:sigma-70 family RNA polymerase sigma factor [Flavihumibacter soli]